MQKILLLFILSLRIAPALAQSIDVSNYQQKYQLPIKKAGATIKVDGVLDEVAWQFATPADNFWQKEPADTAAARLKTEIRVTYDANNLYFGIYCFDVPPYVVQSLKRDSDPGSSDGVGIVLDPVNGRTNGFFFVVNPYNVQAEGLISGGGGDISFSWDNKWFCETKILSDRWVSEIAIPFKSLRYTDGNKTWGINFIRADLKNNEYSTWTKMPVNIDFADFGHTGSMVWDEAPPSPKNNLAFIPYTTGGISHNKKDNEKAKATFNIGFDAKVALSSKLNLDLTVNPDFSQVEVDRQVTNLTRFSIFFPERRTFFLENADMYDRYGTPGIRQFYSRTIGLDKNGNRIPIIAGARLTGNIDNRTRIAAMNIQTAKKGDYAAQNYTAVSASRTVLKRSTIKGYYMGREGFLSEQDKKNNPLDRYGRNAGFELSYNSDNNKWQAWHGYHKSWKFGINDKDKYVYGGAGYNGHNFSSFFNYDDVGVNYFADMGFVQRIENYDAVRDTSIRQGFKGFFNFSIFQIRPKKGNINTHVFESLTNIYWNADRSLNERNNVLAYTIRFKNTSKFSVGVSNSDVRLLFPTSFTDDSPLPTGTYKYTNYNIGYESDGRKKLSFNTGIAAGKFYNGDYQQYTASVNYRVQPWGNFSINFEQNELRFPAPYGRASLFLISPRAEINFSNSIFWTTFFQYNTQAENININSRLQWRFKPMSDLFVVYTDNYYNSPFMKNKNRALVFKLNYWFNL